MNQEVLSQLASWKKKTFRDKPPELPLQDVVDSIVKGEPLVQIVPNKNRDRWVVYRKDIMKPALLCYASVWLWGSPFETGNYVPEGEKRPQELPLGRVQDTPSHLCEISYAFNTSEDRSLYDHVKVLDKLVEDHPGFLKACEGKTLTTFQNGDNGVKNHRYIATSKLFMYKGPYFKMAQVKYRLHPWVKEAVEQKDTRLAPNKSRPRLMDWNGVRWCTVEDTDEDRFKKDDIIWWSFAVVFTIKNQFYSRDLVPMSLVRVGKLDSGSRTIYAPMDTDFDFQDLGDGPGDDSRKEVERESDLRGYDILGGVEDTTDVDGARKRKRDIQSVEEGFEGGSSHGGRKRREMSEAITESELGGVERGVSGMEIDDVDVVHVDGDQAYEEVPAAKKRSTRARR